MSKQYTPVRRFYAWFGFLSLIGVVIAVPSMAFVPAEFSYYNEQKEELLPGVVTAYSSEVEQTDDTPFITASNQHVRDGIVANNCLAFGTKVEINEKVFEVQDRMNSRYSCHHFDIWFAEKQLAVNWGVQYHIIKIIK